MSATDAVLHSQHPQDRHGQAAGGADRPGGLHLCPHQRDQEGGGSL